MSNLRRRKMVIHEPDFSILEDLERILPILRVLARKYSGCEGVNLYFNESYTNLQVVYDLVRNKPSNRS